MKKILLSLLCFAIVGCSKEPEAERQVDVLLIGGGIMSATLGTYLNELEPSWNIEAFERLDQIAQESSNPWNNAGTGHSAFAELNYTPENKEGGIEIARAVAINEQFEISKQFWAYQVEQGVMSNPKAFINNTPHMSFVWGDDNVNFLRKRHAAMQDSTLFRGMEYSEDPEQIKRWVPLIMEGREPGQVIAATRVSIGTDVNFGEITKQLFASLQKKSVFKLHVKHEVRDIKRNEDGTWKVVVADLGNNEKLRAVNSKFVFIGAGGAALKLLQLSGIPEADGYAGFPVGGSFLSTSNPEIVAQHQAKVYGKAGVGSPPMSVPHLDTRVIDGKKVLLFGPFATFSTKFLKNGSLWDTFGAITTSNFGPMLNAGWDNLALSRYLIGQLMLSEKDRLESLREYYPEAVADDWQLIQAGQRVQIIKRDPKLGGVLQFGTEVVSAQDGSISALLGASPGASTSPPIMLRLLETNFKDKMQSPEWQAKLKEIIPSYGQKLNGNLELTNSIRKRTSGLLELPHVEVKAL